MWVCVGGGRVGVLVCVCVCLRGRPGGGTPSHSTTSIARPSAAAGTRRWKPLRLQPFPPLRRRTNARSRRRASTAERTHMQSTQHTYGQHIGTHIDTRAHVGMQRKRQIKYSAAWNRSSSSPNKKHAVGNVGNAAERTQQEAGQGTHTQQTAHTHGQQSGRERTARRRALTGNHARERVRRELVRPRPTKDVLLLVSPHLQAVGVRGRAVEWQGRAVGRQRKAKATAAAGQGKGSGGPSRRRPWPGASAGSDRGGSAARSPCATRNSKRNTSHSPLLCGHSALSVQPILAF